MPIMHSPAARSTQRGSVCICVLALASAALLAPTPAAADLKGVCARVDDSFIQSLASNPNTLSTDGCGAPGAEEFEACEVTYTPGLCSAVPACSQATYEPQQSVLCTPDTIDGACCTEIKSKPCPTCEVVTDLCMELCPRPEDGSAIEPTVSSLALSRAIDLSGNTELTDATCAKASELYLDLLTQQLAGAGTVVLPCSQAAESAACDSRGYVGLCSAVPDCGTLGTATDAHCTSQDDDSGCCLVLLEKPCPTCDPEPASCTQSCPTQEALVTSTSTTSNTSSTETPNIHTAGSSPSTRTPSTTSSTVISSTNAAAPVRGLRGACAAAVSAVAGAVLCALL